MFEVVGKFCRSLTGGMKEFDFGGRLVWRVVSKILEEGRSRNILNGLLQHSDGVQVMVAVLQKKG